MPSSRKTLKPLGAVAIRPLERLGVERRVEGSGGGGPGQVDADDAAGRDHRQHAGDARPDVGAVRGEPLVAEPGHQLGPRLSDAEEVEARGGQRRREPVAGQARDDDVEGVGRIAAVGPRVGERSDESRELDRGARPAVREDEGQGIGLGGPDVEEVDGLAVDVGGELRELR